MQLSTDTSKNSIKVQFEPKTSKQNAQLQFAINQSINSINQLEVVIASKLDEISQSDDSSRPMVVNRSDDVLREVDRDVNKF